MIKRNLMRGAVLLLEAMAAMREAVPAHCHQYPSLRGQLAEAVQLAIRSPTHTNHSSEGRARRDGGISIKARCASARIAAASNSSSTGSTRSASARSAGRSIHCQGGWDD